MKYKRCKWAAIILTLVVGLAIYARLQAAGITLASDLEGEGRKAEQICVPLLLEFAADDCEYCTLLEQEVLNPTLLNRDYDRRVLMRKLLIDRTRKLRDFTGQLVEPGELAERYRVFVTPTLLFLDSEGRELAERMVGVMTLEFYGGYLDQALDEARAKLGKLPHCE